MSKIASKNSQVFIGATPTQLTNVSDWSMSTARNAIDVSTIGTEWKEFLSGQITATGSCTMLFDPDDTEGSGVIESAMWNGTEITFYVRPEGSASGKVQYSFTALITAWDISAATEDAIKIALSFQATGAITKGTLPEGGTTPE